MRVRVGRKHSVAFNPSCRGLLVGVKRTEMLRRGNACF